METKSRVVKYESLRKEIEKMEDYSFNTVSSQQEDSSLSTLKKHKNSISAEELDALLLSEKIAKENETKVEIKKKYKSKKKEEIRNRNGMTQGKVLLFVLIPIVLIVAAFLILIFTGVI